MPYTLKTLPPHIKELPQSAQKTFMETFNSAYADCKKNGLSHGNKSCDAQAFRIANSALNKLAGKK